MIRRTLVVFATVQIALFAAGCGAEAGSFASSDDTSENDVGESMAELYRTGTPWPGRAIPVCWTQSAGQRSDFPALSASTEQAIARSWGQATGLRFTGWGLCGSSVAGKMHVDIVEGVVPHAGVGFSSGGTGIVLEPFRSDFVAVAIHEFGHALGYHHEHQRPDFELSCQGSDVTGGDGLDTEPDQFSIMSSTGYCQGLDMLSYWDISGTQRVYGHPNYFADVTGDGRADAILVNSNAVVVRTSSGTAFNAQSNWTTAAWFGLKGTAFADVTGDGKADLIGIDNNAIYVRPSNGTSFPSAGQAQWTPTGWWGKAGTYFADVTGDGKADVIGIDVGATFVRVSNGTQFAGPSQTWSTLPHTGRQFFADVTGDGKADSINVNQTNVVVHVSTGTTFQAGVAWAASAWYGARATAVADVNGDGKADLVGVDNNSVFVRLSTGTGFSTHTAWIASSWFGQRGTFFGDANGDGRADILGVDDGGVFVRRSNGSSFPSSTQSNWTGGAYFGNR